jgi:hypothetical protein
VTQVGEYGLAREDIAGILAHDKTAITDQERDDMLGLARRMKMEEDKSCVSRALAACPRAE